MAKTTKTLEFKFERTIPAPPSEVFDAWLNPKIPGNPWNAAEKFILDPKVDGLFYWTLKGTPHYGRFTEIERPGRMRHTWVSPKTLGQESIVTLTFETQGEGTLMTLVHSDLPDHELARGHEKGWNYFLDTYREQFGNGSREEYRWENAHPEEAPKNELQQEIWSASKCRLIPKGTERLWSQRAVELREPTDTRRSTA